MKVYKQQLQSILDNAPVNIKQQYKFNVDNVLHNEQTQLTMFLLSHSILSYADVEKMAKEFIQRNPFYSMFPLEAGTLGTASQNYIKSLLPQHKLSKPIDTSYDILFDGIRIEVKASRAAITNTGKNKTNSNITERAMTSEDLGDYKLTFAQTKPSCCDMFVLVCFWTDKACAWVLTSKELNDIPSYRTIFGRLGTEGKGLLIVKRKQTKLFDAYKVSLDNLESAIIAASKR